MTTNDELANLGERPATPEEEAEALCVAKELERQRRGEPPSPAGPELGTTVHRLGEHVERVVDHARAFELEELGRLFPQYVPLEWVGQGGMGVVYLVRHLWLNCPVALKVLPTDVAADPEFLERFRREAQALALLDHPHIVRVMDFGKSVVEDFFYLAMAYLDGGSLRERLRPRPLAPREALTLAARICDALEHAHAKGVIHRDVSPENILFDREGNVKLADLGLARVCGDVGLTRSTQGLGKQHYMAPEQSESAATVGPRADVYSVGVLLYEMLTGKLPKGEHAPASQAVGAEAWAAARVDGPRVDAIIRRARQADPDQRFQSAADMKAAIEKELEENFVGGGGGGGGDGGGLKWLWYLAAGLCLTFVALLVHRATRTPATAEKGVLRWGADLNGGAPFAWEERGKLKGFEAELIAHVGDRTQLRPKHVQVNWDMLPQALQRGDIDVIFNGYGWSPQFAHQMNATIPYSILPLRLIVRKGDPTVRDWDDLRRPGPAGRLRVGTLRASDSEKYLLRHFAETVDIEAPGGNGTSAVLWALEKGKRGGFDASVQDEFTARHYLKHDFPGLEMVGAPAKGNRPFIVAYTRRDNRELRDQLNEVLGDMIRDGALKKVCTRYDVWSEEQEKLEEVGRQWPPSDEPAREGLGTYAWLLLKAAGMTVLLAGVAMPLAMLLGLLVAIGRVYGPRWLRLPLAGYVELLRGTPLLLQLFVIYYLLPDVGIFLPAFWAGVVGLAVNYSAYESENYRAGILAVPRGQMEAALTLGLSRWSALRRVVLPQALRTVVPPVTNDFVGMLKDTSVCSVIAVVELTGRYQRLLVDQPQLILHFALMAALLYLLMSYPLSLVARRLERRPQPAVA